MIFVFPLPSFPVAPCCVYFSCVQRQTCREVQFSFKFSFSLQSPFKTWLKQPDLCSCSVWSTCQPELSPRTDHQQHLVSGFSGKPLIVLPALLITEWECTKSIRLGVARSFSFALVREQLSEFNGVVMGCLDSVKYSPGLWGPRVWHAEFEQIETAYLLKLGFYDDLIGPLKMAACEPVRRQVVTVILSHNSGVLAWQMFTDMLLNQSSSPTGACMFASCTRLLSDVLMQKAEFRVQSEGNVLPSDWTMLIHFTEFRWFTVRFKSNL